MSSNSPPKSQASKIETSKTVYDSEKVFSILESDNDENAAKESWRKPLPEDVLFALDQSPDIRSEKVEQVKKEMEAGTYTIDAKKLGQVAEAMINSDDVVFKLLD